jgi:hypothetical protein
MKKMLRFETCEARGRTEVVEVPSDSPLGVLYSDRGRNYATVTTMFPSFCPVSAYR